MTTTPDVNDDAGTATPALPEQHPLPPHASVRVHVYPYARACPTPGPGVWSAVLSVYLCTRGASVLCGVDDGPVYPTLNDSHDYSDELENELDERIVCSLHNNNNNNNNKVPDKALPPSGTFLSCHHLRGHMGSVTTIQAHYLSIIHSLRSVAALTTRLRLSTTHNVSIVVHLRSQRLTNQLTLHEAIHNSQLQTLHTICLAAADPFLTVCYRTNRTRLSSRPKDRTVRLGGRKKGHTICSRLRLAATLCNNPLAKQHRSSLRSMLRYTPAHTHLLHASVYDVSTVASHDAMAVRASGHSMIDARFLRRLPDRKGEMLLRNVREAPHGFVACVCGGCDDDNNKSKTVRMSVLGTVSVKVSVWWPSMEAEVDADVERTKVQRWTRMLVVDKLPVPVHVTTVGRADASFMPKTLVFKPTHGRLAFEKASVPAIHREHPYWSSH